MEAPVPDLVRLRNIGGQDLAVAPLGGRVVGADCIIDITGRQHAHQDTCRTDGCPGCRVWPAAVWRNETPARKSAKE